MARSSLSPALLLPKSGPFLVRQRLAISPHRVNESGSRLPGASRRRGKRPLRADGRRGMRRIIAVPRVVPQQYLDQALRLATVADRDPSRIDAAGQRGVGDDPAQPDSGNQVLLADDLVAPADQMHQEVEDFGFDRQQPSPRCSSRLSVSSAYSSK